MPCTSTERIIVKVVVYVVDYNVLIENFTILYYDSCTA